MATVEDLRARLERSMNPQERKHLRKRIAELEAASKAPAKKAAARKAAG